MNVWDVGGQDKIRPLWRWVAVAVAGGEGVVVVAVAAAVVVVVVVADVGIGDSLGCATEPVVLWKYPISCFESLAIILTHTKSDRLCAPLRG
jgi:hypothetical protein